MGLKKDKAVSSRISAEARLEGARRQLDELLLHSVAHDASDLHLSVGNPPYFRVHGLLRPREREAVLDARLLDTMADILLGDRDRRKLHVQGALDGAVTAPDGSRFRFNVFRSQGHTSIALRKLEEEFQTLAQLGLPEQLYELCESIDGLVVIAGPTGAGKSTTLATLLHRINQTRHGHIVTIEDPVEYVHQPIKCLINQREIGRDASNFDQALVAAMRQDPDVILVGEIRDLNTIRTAITAAETGHLVFTTVHASDCVGAIERLVAVFPSDEQDGIRRQLSLVLRAIISQHLLVADGQSGPLSPSCHRCEDEPKRRARVVASEILFCNAAISNLIAFAKSAQIYSALETAQAQGMQTLEQDLARLWTSGEITEKTAFAISRNPSVLRERAAAIKGRRPRRAGGAR